MAERFTIDGSPEIETQLAGICERVVSAVRAIVPARKLEAVVLGGGYGRGEGGVFKEPTGERPYNDMEFYVFLRGNRLLNARRYQKALDHAGAELSPQAGLHVEFKVDSLERLRRSPVTMFSYDLVSAHNILFGSPTIFDECGHHKRADQIPIAEATRLLFNRCSGLLLAKDLLRAGILEDEQSDFVFRNLAKAKLAVGDAVLAVQGQYHWSCRTRHERLVQIGNDVLPGMQQIRETHAAGVEFKLHPHRTDMTRAELVNEHDRVASLTRAVWFWVEERRLKRNFNSVFDYAADKPSPDGKEAWRNRILNLRTFGLGAAFDPMVSSYPRERLFRALPVLLWSNGGGLSPEATRQVQRVLRTDESQWEGLIATYKRIWPSYG